MMNPHKSRTAVSGSSILVRMTTRGGDHWLVLSRALVPSLTVDTTITVAGWFHEISSDNLCFPKYIECLADTTVHLHIQHTTLTSVMKFFTA